MAILDAWRWWYHAGAGWHVGGMGALLLGVAVLVNRFAREQRLRLRRAVVFYALFVGGTLVRALVAEVGIASAWVSAGVSLFEALLVVQLAAALVLGVALPRLGISLLRITTDLGLGAVYLLVAATVLGAAGVDVGSMLAASTVIAAILTISLQSTLGNVFGGLAVQLDRSINVGEWVRFDDGREGRVSEIRWRHTTLETRDNDTIVLPNALLLSSRFTILGKVADKPAPHRLSIEFHVDFRFPPSRVCAVAEAALRATAIPNVVASPPPDCVCLDLGREWRDSVGIYAARIFVDQVAPDQPTASLARARIYAALRREGIPLARPAVSQFTVPADEDAAGARRERHAVRAAETLARLELFATLHEEERTELARSLIYTPFTAGETIMRQGNVAHHLYILDSGRVDICIAVEGGHKVVAQLAERSYFGEMGLMTGEPRRASVVAVTDVACLRLDKAAFHAVLKARPEIAQEVSEVLARRRVELEMAREELDSESRLIRVARERQRILAGIRGFFGIDES